MEFWDTLTQSETLARDAWEWTGTEFRKRSYEEVYRASRHVAAGLRKRGVGPGSVVAAVITNGPSATSGFIGVWFAGATLASLPIISRGMTVPYYVSQLRRLCRHVGADYLLAEERFIEFLPPELDLGVELVGYQALVETSTAAAPEPPALEDTIFVQFSSGTTGEPRGVELSGHGIEAQLVSLAGSVAIDPEIDVGYTWLPQSHDMGFFGCVLLALYSGMSGVISTPERFLQSPRSWFDDCAEFGVTVTAGPPLALSVAARAERAHPGHKQLALRLCLVGAEQIAWSALVDATNAFADRGLTLDTFTAAYGLAEATLAVTLGELDREPRYLDVDADRLGDGIVSEVAADDARARRLVAVGTPIPGTEVTVDAATGEILVKSRSLTRGYFANPALTAERLREDELSTGDIGFVRDGQLYITGRSDDLLIIGGRNIFVQELEAEMGAQPGVRTGNCAIVEVDGSSGEKAMVVVAETRSGETDAADLASRLRRIAREVAGLTIRDVVFVPTGTFPKTPSGKVQRYRCKEIVNERLAAAALRA